MPIYDNSYTTNNPIREIYDYTDTGTRTKINTVYDYTAASVGTVVYKAEEQLYPGLPMLFAPAPNQNLTGTFYTYISVSPAGGMNSRTIYIQFNATPYASITVNSALFWEGPAYCYTGFWLQDPATATYDAFNYPMYTVGNYSNPSNYIYMYRRGGAETVQQGEYPSVTWDLTTINKIVNLCFGTYCGSGDAAFSRSGMNSCIAKYL